MIIVDTNILIEAAKKNNPSFQFLKNTVAKEKIHLSVITIAEFLARASASEKRMIERLILNSEILVVDEQVARIAAKYRQRFLKTSRTKSLDYIIAAQAKVHNLTLVTNNKSDFPMKDIKIISP